MHIQLLHNAVLVNEGFTSPGYLLIADDRILAVGYGLVPQELEPDSACDLGGALVLPGAIDVHVHFRQPGLEHKGTIASESRAALAGGVTSYLEMPNTRPATTTLQAWRDKMATARATSACNYGFFLGAEAGNLTELLEADYTRVPGVKVFMGSSTGGMLLDDEHTLRRILEQVPAPVTVHAESEERVRTAADAARRRYPVGHVPMECHSDIRSERACLEATLRAVTLARETGARLHVAHVSTAAELRVIKAAGPLVTCETCPQYLLFSTDDYPRLGARIKCNPAVKTPADREALRRACRRGDIHCVATDHAPHLPADKAGDALTAASGMPGVQYLLPLMLSLFDPATVARLTAHGPASVYGIAGRGYLRPGCYADLAVVEPAAPGAEITDASVLSPCGWTPYAGMRLPWRVARVMINGRWAGDPQAQARPLRFAPAPKTPNHQP